MEKHVDRLPIELVNKIINYTDIVAFRNGKYIDRIPKSDERYKQLEKIPKPVRIGSHKIIFNLINYSCDKPVGYLIEYLYTDYIKITLKFAKIIIDGSYRIYIEKPSVKYTYNVNGWWSPIVDYFM
jgi:hypothetical protein